MTTENDPISDRIAALFQEYRNQLPERLAQIETQFADLKGDPANIEKQSSLVFLLHKLAGSGATFGFDEITRIARQWEHMIQPRLKQAPTPISTVEFDEMDRLLIELRAAVDAGHNSN